MKAISQIITSLLLVAFVSCENQNTPKAHQKLNITGYWTNPVYGKNQITYKRTSLLKDNEYGLALNTDKSLMERKNSGWCGTPPISYADFDGTWNRIDSTIYISVAYWGGTAEYEWRIKSINDKSLSITIIDQEHIWEQE